MNAFSKFVEVTLSVSETSKTVQEGDQVVLDCSTRGRIQPTIVWTKLNGVNMN